MGAVMSLLKKSLLAAVVLAGLPVRGSLAQVPTPQNQFLDGLSKVMQAQNDSQKAASDAQIRAMSESGRVHKEMYQAQTERVRANADAHAKHMEAFVTGQKVRELDLQNDKVEFLNRIEKQKTGAEHRQQLRDAAREQARTVGDPLREQQRLQRRLAYAEFDPYSGTVFWPEVLRKQLFDAYRETIETLLQRRAKADLREVHAEDRSVALTAHEKLESTLKTKRSSMPATEYMRCKNFVERVGFEIREPRQTAEMTALAGF